VMTNALITRSRLTGPNMQESPFSLRSKTPPETKAGSTRAATASVEKI
jgi:hypothetical protein